MSEADWTRALPTVAAQIEAGIEAGLHLGVQAYVSIDGEIVADAALGWAEPDRRLTSDDVLPWLSAGKPLTAVATLMLLEQCGVELDAPVAAVLPEFGAQGKEQVTFRHLLTHTAGLQPIDPGWPQADWETIVDRICRSRLRHGWRLGSQGAYDPSRSWFMLGAAIERLSGMRYAAFLDRELCQPLGMDHSSPAATHLRSTKFIGRLAPMHACRDGVCVPLEAPQGEQLAPSPGGSWRGPARELGRFYECLLADGGCRGRSAINPRLLAELRRRQRVGLHDLTFQHPIDFGLGVIIDSNRYGAETVPYGYGRHCSPDTFGHGGSQSTIGFADPRHRLTVVLLANGSPGEPAHQARHRELCSAVYRDLGLG